MKISLDWLHTHLAGDARLAAEQVAEKLADAGLGVERIDPLPDSAQQPGEAQQPDYLLDVEVTSNRNDCNNHRGVAREVAVLFDIPLKPVSQVLPVADASGLPPAGVNVRLDAPELCEVYTARVIRGVKVEPSPQWLVRRLEAIGQRPVNNVVDITNFVMFDLGQPLHAFDLAAIRGQQIVVRRSGDGETFQALNHSSYKLDRNDLTIADAERVIALAGVMGGLDSEVSATTTDVLLESARFSAMHVRNTSRKLGLRSEASYRFERGLDPTGTLTASHAAAGLIVRLCGGTIDGGLAIAGESTPPPRTVTLRLARLRHLLGYDIPPGTGQAILASLGFDLLHIDAGSITVGVPTWRPDVNQEVDLIEEIARIYGYKHIPYRDAVTIQLRTPTPRQQVRNEVMQTLVACGFSEAINPSLLPDSAVGLFGPPSSLKASARHRKADGTLRDTVAASLLIAARHNEQHAPGDVRLFEIATVFAASDDLPAQPTHLGLLTPGPVASGRGVIQTLFDRLHQSARLTFAVADRAGLAAGLALAIEFDHQPIGWLGRIAPDVEKTLDLRSACVVGELDLGPLFAAGIPVARLTELPRFPGIQRDLSILVPAATAWARIEGIVRACQVPALEQVRFGETFKGKGIPAGQKSVFFSMLFRRPDANLTHEEVDGWQAQVVEQLGREVGATVRGA